MKENPNNIILKVNNLSVEIDTPVGTVHAVRGVSFELQAGEVLAIVGESGCGKSMLCKSIMRLLPRSGRISGGSMQIYPGAGVEMSGGTAGEQVLEAGGAGEDKARAGGVGQAGPAGWLGEAYDAEKAGVELTGLSERDMRGLRGRLFSMVFQDPMSALDPTMCVGAQIAEAVTSHNRKASRAEVYNRVIELMRLVGIDHPEDRYKLYPHNFSGGMRQRSVFAMALASNPKILIADEPTTSLDVTIQAQILDLLREIQEKLGTATILVSHDLGVVARAADRVAVMYAGKIVEVGTAEDIYYDPRHPYTVGLLKSLPSMAMRRYKESLAAAENKELASKRAAAENLELASKRAAAENLELASKSATAENTDPGSSRAAGEKPPLYTIPGMPPSLIHPPKGDAFASRNPDALPIDFEEMPPMLKISETHYAAVREGALSSQE